MKRFSIRDLLWLTLVVAILLAWWWEHRRYAQYKASIGVIVRYYELGPLGGDVSSEEFIRELGEEIPEYPAVEWMYPMRYRDLQNEVERLHEELAAEKAKNGTK
jgi:hypothetical protein